MHSSSLRITLLSHLQLHLQPPQHHLQPPQLHLQPLHPPQLHPQPLARISMYLSPKMKSPLHCHDEEGRSHQGDDDAVAQYTSGGGSRRQLQQATHLETQPLARLLTALLTFSLT